MEERELALPDDQVLLAWRLFRVRGLDDGYALCAPLIHDPDYEVFPSRIIEASCYDAAHPAPAPSCRCGLYGAVEGTLDSLSGYLTENAGHPYPPIYAEVACSGRVFLDHRGVRAQRIEIRRLAGSPAVWPSRDRYLEARAALEERYGVVVADLESLPRWVVENDMPTGAPTGDHSVSLDALLTRLVIGDSILSRCACPGDRRLCASQGGCQSADSCVLGDQCSDGARPCPG